MIKYSKIMYVKLNKYKLFLKEIIVAYYNQYKGMLYFLYYSAKNAYFSRF